MKAVVTGSAGFIGSHLVDTLVGHGYLVTGIDRRSRPPRRGYRHVSLDLADDPATTGLADLIDHADLVFHLAAKPGVRGNGSTVQAMRRRDNVIATRHLLSVTPGSTPVVATSSSSVYGGTSGGSPSREGDLLQPRGGYARSKVAMEDLCAIRRDSGGIVAVVRPFTVAGEGQRSDMAFSRWITALWKGEPLEIFGSGLRSRDITDIRDVVGGLIRAGERQINETVNLGSGMTHRLIDMARLMIDLSGGDADIVVQPAPSDEVEVTLADTKRCGLLLGFVPQTDLPALFARQVEATPRIPAMAVT